MGLLSKQWCEGGGLKAYLANLYDVHQSPAISHSPTLDYSRLTFQIHIHKSHLFINHYFVIQYIKLNIKKLVIFKLILIFKGSISREKNYKIFVTGRLLLLVLTNCSPHNYICSLPRCKTSPQERRYSTLFSFLYSFTRMGIPFLFSRDL